MNLKSWLLPFAVLFFLLTACTPNSKKVDKLIIAEANQPVFALIYIAHEKGYFAEQGLEVEFKSFNSGRDALESAMIGEADIATVFETPVVLSTYNSISLSIISTLHHSTKNTALVFRKDKGIDTPKDLRGKRIGVTRHTNAEFFLFLYLSNHGINVSDVTIVDKKPGDLLQAIKNEEVDAVATWNPVLYNIKKSFDKGETGTFFSDVYTELSVLAGMREVISQKERTMQKLLQGIVMAEEFIRKNPDEALNLVVKRLPQLEEDTIRGCWNAFTPEVVLNKVLLDVLTQEGEWFKSFGLYTRPVPDFSKVVNSKYLKEIKPEAVTGF